jgi:hypothetical protein
LALSSPLQRFLALRLKDVAASSPQGHLWANVVHDMFSATIRTPCSFGPPQAWHGTVPSQGTLALDYVQLEPPPPGGTQVADGELAAFLVEALGAPAHLVQALLEEATVQLQPQLAQRQGQADEPGGASGCRGLQLLELGSAARAGGFMAGAGAGTGPQLGGVLVAQQDFDREAAMMAALRREWKSSWTVKCRQVTPGLHSAADPRPDPCALHACVRAPAGLAPVCGGLLPRAPPLRHCRRRCRRRSWRWCCRCSTRRPTG